MGRLEILEVIDKWHKKEEDDFQAIVGTIDRPAKERLARELKMLFDAQAQSDGGVNVINEKPRRGRPPKNR
jgi:hypothetical protein